MRQSEAERRGAALAQLEKLGRCSVPNAALLMGIHHHTLRKYAETGEVEAFWVGTRPWFMKAEIERFHREGKRTLNPAPDVVLEHNEDEATDFGGEDLLFDDPSSTFFD